MLGMLALAALALVTPSEAVGVFFHGWTGSSAGSEWLLCFEVDDNRMRCADVLGNGFEFRLGNDGAMDVVAEAPCQGGTGQFTGGLMELDWRCWGMVFSSRARRAPMTDEAFPVVLRSRARGDKTLSGRWDVVVQQVSPVTGAVLNEAPDEARLSVDDDLLSIELRDGTSFRGVFETSEKIAFRVREGRVTDARFETFEGSATSLDQDVMGVAWVRSASTIELNLLLQTRAKVGDQIQYQYRYAFTR